MRTLLFCSAIHLDFNYKQNVWLHQGAGSCAETPGMGGGGEPPHQRLCSGTIRLKFPVRQSFILRRKFTGRVTIFFLKSAT